MKKDFGIITDEEDSENESEEDEESEEDSEKWQEIDEEQESEPLENIIEETPANYPAFSSSQAIAPSLEAEPIPTTSSTQTQQSETGFQNVSTEQTQGEQESRIYESNYEQRNMMETDEIPEAVPTHAMQPGPALSQDFSLIQRNEFNPRLTPRETLNIRPPTKEEKTYEGKLDQEKRDRRRF